ncbi:soluble lamin-associated protein of 75 kDa-like [Notamacropus eugenii]|uniref:soluble lamin-associated protein of 75 kDa-like n=1 Tax=Notamacropus eugenii TaxID=9315 RepID=UPI003B6777CC
MSGQTSAAFETTCSHSPILLGESLHMLGVDIPSIHTPPGLRPASYSQPGLAHLLRGFPGVQLLQLLGATACRQYFEKYPGDHDLLWEVEGTGQWHQRIPIISALQREAFRHAGVSQSEVRKLTFEDCDTAPTSKDEIGCGENQPHEMQVDPVREKGISDPNASTSEGLDNTSINTQTRSIHLKRPKIGKRFHDSEIDLLQDMDENTPQASSMAPISRLESTAYTSESSEELVEDEPDESVVDFEQERKDKDQHILETQGLSKSVSEKKDDEEV